MRIAHLMTGVALAAAVGVAQAATEVVPVSYTFDAQTDSGSYDYYDGASHLQPSFTELTDGVYGRAGWAVDLGHGHAAEWVGWVYDTPVNIDFDFGHSVNIQQIKVGSTQDDLGDVVLPSIDVSYWNGASWVAAASLAVPESSANDVSPSSLDPHGFLDLGALNITAQKIRVTAKHSVDGPWTFIDEVDFYGTTSAVPEPSAYGLALAGLGVLALLRRRRAG